MKTMDLFKKGFSNAELSLALVIIAILAGTIVGFSDMTFQSQEQCDQYKIEKANSEIASIYAQYLQNVSRDEVMAMLSSKDNFVEGYRQHWGHNPQETSLEVTNFRGNSQTVDGIIETNGVSIGFEYIPVHHVEHYMLLTEAEKMKIFPVFMYMKTI